MYVAKRSTRRMSGCGIGGCRPLGRRAPGRRLGLDTGNQSDGSFVFDNTDSSNYAPNMVSPPYTGNASGINNSTGTTSGGADANKANGWLTLATEALKKSGSPSAPTTAKNGKGAASTSAPAGGSWLTQQSNTTLAISGVAGFALLLAITR